MRSSEPPRDDQGVDGDGARSGVAMTGLRSTSRMSGRSTPSRPSATMSVGDRRAVDRRADRGRREERAGRAGRRASPAPPRGVDRREPDRDVVEDLGEDPAEADQDRRPELRVAAQPDDQLDARVGHRLDEQAADVEPVPARRPSSRSPAAAADRVVAVEARGATPPRSLLWASPSASSLSATRAAERAAPPRRRRRHRARRRASVTAQPGGARAAPGSRARTACARAAAPARPATRRLASAPYDVRSAASAGQPARHGPAVRRRPRLVTPSQRATDAIAAERLDGPAQQRRAAALLVEQRLGLGRRLARGQRHVDRQDRRAVAGRRRAAGGVTSFAVATSDGSDRYGKSWTSDEDVVGARRRHRLEAGAVGGRRVGRAPRVERVADVAHRRQRARGSPPAPTRGIGGRSSPVVGDEVGDERRLAGRHGHDARSGRARRRGRSGAMPSTSSAVSSSSSRSRQRMTPAASSAASVTRASPASDPEWATAAACAWSLRPDLDGHDRLAELAARGRPGRGTARVA